MTYKWSPNSVAESSKCVIFVSPDLCSPSAGDFGSRSLVCLQFVCQPGLHQSRDQNPLTGLQEDWQDSVLLSWVTALCQPCSPAPTQGSGITQDMATSRRAPLGFTLKAAFTIMLMKIKRTEFWSVSVQRQNQIMRFFFLNFLNWRITDCKLLLLFLGPASRFHFMYCSNFWEHCFGFFSFLLRVLIWLSDNCCYFLRH